MNIADAGAVPQPGQTDWLLVSVSGASSSGGESYAMLFSGSSIANDQKISPTPRGPLGAIRDYNFDGVADVMYTDGNSSSILVGYDWNSSNPTKNAKQYGIHLGTDIQTSASGDFDGDGRPDIIGAQNSKIYLYFNTTAQPVAFSPLSPSVTGLGREARAGWTMTGRFTFGGRLDLSASALSLFGEVVGSGEAVSGLPITLVADPRNSARVGIFAPPAGVHPVMELKIGAQGKGQFNFSLKSSRASSAVPSRCPSTTLTSRIVLEDGTNPPVVLATTQPWSCFGKGHQYMRTP